MHYLYKFVNKGGEILYIGETKDLKRRMKDHRDRRTDNLWRASSDIYFATVDTQKRAKKWEGLLIEKHLPLYNKKDNIDWGLKIDVNEPDWTLLDEKCVGYFEQNQRCGSFKPIVSIQDSMTQQVEILRSQIKGLKKENEWLLEREKAELENAQQNFELYNKAQQRTIELTSNVIELGSKCLNYESECQSLKKDWAALMSKYQNLKGKYKDLRDKYDISQNSNMYGFKNFGIYIGK